MSFTEIYAFDKAGIPRLYGVVHNAWRGAMAVWNIMEERHLPPFVPEYIKLCNWYRPGIYGWAANPWVWAIGFERTSEKEAKHESD